MPLIKKEYHINVTTDGEFAVNLLAQQSNLSHAKLKQAMQKGALWVERNNHVQRLRRVKKTLHAGDTLHFYYDEQVLASVPSAAQLIADEVGYSVWFKPFGMLSQGSKWADHCTIYRWVEQHLKPQRPAFIVHRLDRAATGLILLAHSKKMAAAISKQFQDRTIKKCYRVVVHGKFSADMTCMNTPIDGRAALSNATLVKYDADKNYSLLAVEIETGRKHQIRRHLSEIGFPVVGDRLYGNNGDQENLQLAAYSLEFTCPLSGKPKCYQSPSSLLQHFSVQI